MPKMNGFELYEKIREQDDTVKVCFMTPYYQHLHGECSKHQQMVVKRLEIR